MNEALRPAGFTITEKKLIDGELQRFQPDKGGYIDTAHEYKRFLEAFVHAGRAIDLDQYAEKRGGIKKDKFALVADIAGGAEHSPTHYPMYSDELALVRTDAPYVYALVHEPTSETPEVVSIVAFRIDPVKRLLLIDQIQGGDTSGKPTSKAYAARKLFRNAMPEYALYDAARQFALSVNLRAIGIRKPVFSEILTVQKKAEKGEHTLYSKLAKYAKHEGTPAEMHEYTYERLLQDHTSRVQG